MLPLPLPMSCEVCNLRPVAPVFGVVHSGLTVLQAEVEMLLKRRTSGNQEFDGRFAPIEDQRAGTAGQDQAARRRCPGQPQQHPRVGVQAIAVETGGAAVGSWRGGGRNGGHRPRQRHPWDTGQSMDRGALLE